MRLPGEEQRLSTAGSKWMRDGRSPLGRGDCGVWVGCVDGWRTMGSRSRQGWCLLHATGSWRASRVFLEALARMEGVVRGGDGKRKVIW